MTGPSASARPEPGPPARPPQKPTKKVRRWWRPLRMVLSFVLLGVAVWFVIGKSSELSGASVFLTQLRWPWLAAGGFAELCSYLALAELQRSLLRSGGTRMGLVRATLITFSGSAIQSALPAGAAFAGVYEFRQYEFVGADEVLAGFVVIGSGVVAFFTLAGLAGLGLGLAASGASSYDLVGAIVGVLCAAVLVLIAWSRRSGMYAALLRVTAWAERRRHKPAGQWSSPVQTVVERVRAIAPTPRSLSRAGAASAGAWMADCTCLAMAFLAVGAGVPWRGLLLAYCGGQLAVNLPITPGGLGVVEGSLTLALEYFGGGQASTVAAVLLYRVMSYWVPLPVGGVSYLIMARRHQKETKSAGAMTAAPPALAQRTEPGAPGLPMEQQGA